MILKTYYGCVIFNVSKTGRTMYSKNTKPPKNNIFNIKIAGSSSSYRIIPLEIVNQNTFFRFFCDTACECTTPWCLPCYSMVLAATVTNGKGNRLDSSVPLERDRWRIKTHTQTARERERERNGKKKELERDGETCVMASRSEQSYEYSLVTINRHGTRMAPSEPAWNKYINKSSVESSIPAFLDSLSGARSPANEDCV